MNDPPMGGAIQIIAMLRERLQHSPLGEQFVGKNDEQMLRRVFTNHRQGRGLRLTPLGQQMMSGCFRSHVFETSDGEHERPSCLLYLDRNLTMPYYWVGNNLTLYDQRFAVWLSLVGSVTALVEIETIEA